MPTAAMGFRTIMSSMPVGLRYRRSPSLRLRAFSYVRRAVGVVGKRTARELLHRSPAEPESSALRIKCGLILSGDGTPLVIGKSRRRSAQPFQMDKSIVVTLQDPVPVESFTAKTQAVPRLGGQVIVTVGHGKLEPCAFPPGNPYACQPFTTRLLRLERGFLPKNTSN